MSVFQNSAIGRSTCWNSGSKHCTQSGDARRRRQDFGSNGEVAATQKVGHTVALAPQKQKTRVRIPPGYKILGVTQQLCFVYLTMCLLCIWLCVYFGNRSIDHKNIFKSRERGRNYHARVCTWVWNCEHLVNWPKMSRPLRYSPHLKRRTKWRSDGLSTLVGTIGSLGVVGLIAII
jgi:hypothetical protein